MLVKRIIQAEVAEATEGKGEEERKKRKRKRKRKERSGKRKKGKPTSTETGVHNVWEVWTPPITVHKRKVVREVQRENPRFPPQIPRMPNFGPTKSLQQTEALSVGAAGSKCE